MSIVHTFYSIHIEVLFCLWYTLKSCIHFFKNYIRRYFLMLIMFLSRIIFKRKTSLSVLLNGHYLRFLLRKYCMWKLKKYSEFSINTKSSYLKNISVGFHLKPGINIFACKQIKMLIEWMSEGPIFNVNVEHWLLRSRRKILPVPR